MTIEEKLIRKNTADIIDLGIIAEKLLSGDGGKLLYALTNGQIWQRLQMKTDEKAEDKFELLGELRAYARLLSSVEAMVSDGKSEKEKEGMEEQSEPTESTIASEPNAFQGYGMV